MPGSRVLRFRRHAACCHRTYGRILNFIRRIPRIKDRRHGFLDALPRLLSRFWLNGIRFRETTSRPLADPARLLTLKPGSQQLQALNGVSHLHPVPTPRPLSLADKDALAREEQEEFCDAGLV